MNVIKGYLLLKVAGSVGNFIAFKIIFEKFSKVDGNVFNALFCNITDANKAGKD